MLKSPFYLVLLSVLVITNCSVEASRKPDPDDSKTAPVQNDSSSSAVKGPTIKIEPNSPADTVRVFYKDLREKRFREAIYLTNLRPAIEGLTDTELKEFQLDFESLSVQVPEELQINGEIISGDSATVTARFPNEDTDKLEVQQVKLRREGDVWIILTVDEEAEKKIRQEGKNYFFQLRIETHEEEARRMLDRISKAEMAYSLTNKGIYGEMPFLIQAGFLPSDVQTSGSTGYKYTLIVSSDKKSYSASAVPSVYAKTGKLSFAVELDAKGSPRLTSKDNGGKPIKD
jgi:hypothetical protein